jgi:hypothetical protein
MQGYHVLFVREGRSIRSGCNLLDLCTGSSQWYYTFAMNHRICLCLLMHFSVNHWVLYNMARVRYTIEQHVCLVQLYFKYESARNHVQKFILITGSCSFIAWTTVVLHGHSFNSFVALHADVIETPVCCASRLRDFLGRVSSPVPVSSNVSSVNTVHFLSDFLSSNDPVIFSLLTRSCIFCLLGTGSPGNLQWNFLHHILTDSYLK